MTSDASDFLLLLKEVQSEENKLINSEENELLNTEDRQRIFQKISMDSILLKLIGGAGAVLLIFFLPTSAIAQEGPGPLKDVIKVGNPPGTIKEVLTNLGGLKVFLDPKVSKIEKLVVGGKYTCCAAAVTFGQIAPLLPAGYTMKNVFNLCCTSSWAGYSVLHVLYPESKIFKP